MASSGPGYAEPTILTQIRLGKLVYCKECGGFRPPGQHAHSRRQIRPAPRPSTVTHNSTTNSEPPRSGRARHSQPPVELDAQEQENRDVDPRELPASPVPMTHQGAKDESSRSTTGADGPVASDEDIGRLDGTQGDSRGPTPPPAAGLMQPTPAELPQPPVTTGRQQSPSGRRYYVERQPRDRNSERRLVHQHPQSRQQNGAQQVEVTTGHQIWILNQPR